MEQEHRKTLKSLFRQACLCVLISCLFGGCFSIDFDKDLWASGSRSQRRRMAKSLIESKQLENLTFEQVVDLLGEPDYKKLVCDAYAKCSEDFYESLEKRIGKPEPGYVSSAYYYLSSGDVTRLVLYVSFRNNRVRNYLIHS